jgi:glutamate-1-semialdehyde aminotransferase
MSTKLIDLVIGGPERANGDGPDALLDPYPATSMPMSGTPNHAENQDRGHGAEVAHTAGTDVDWTNAELHSIASTIEELQRRLEVANTRLSSVAKVQVTESEIGRLFVEAQRFSEDALSKLVRQIHQVLRAAEDKAKQILTEATEEAVEIRRQAQEAAFLSTRTAQELQSAIAGFTTVNNELVQELGALNSMLAPASERRVAAIDRSWGVSESA